MVDVVEKTTGRKHFIFLYFFAKLNQLFFYYIISSCLFIACGQNSSIN
jgi:hypothetical protein